MKEHYPYRTVTLLPGDSINVEYTQLPAGIFNSSTLKRLFGWTEGMQYTGLVRYQRKGEGVTANSLVVEFLDSKTNRHQCTHPVYNIELMIKKGELFNLQYFPNPNPSLFDIPNNNQYSNDTK